MARDVLHLVKAAGLISSHARAHGPGLHADFSHALSRLTAPDHAARAVVKTILEEEDAAELPQAVATCLQHVSDVSKALEVLLISLELDRGIVSHAEEFESSSSTTSSEFGGMMVDTADLDGEGSVSAGRRSVFASPLGMSVVAVSLNQLARSRLVSLSLITIHKLFRIYSRISSYSRFELTRDLLVLQLMLLKCESVGAETGKIVHSVLVPRTVVMTHCYFILVWLTETIASPPPPNSLEQGMRQMAVLRLQGGAEHISSTHLGAEGLVELARSSRRPLTLAELFLRGPGGARARQLLSVSSSGGSGGGGGAFSGPASSGSDGGATGGAWRSALAPLINISAQLLWPKCAVPVLQEFLIAACQHMQIQEYVRLLSTWCDWNCHSRQFLLGSALLNMGEPEKAADWMEKAAGGVPRDRYSISSTLWLFCHISCAFCVSRFLVSQLFTPDEEKAGTEQGSLQVLTIHSLVRYFD